MADGGTEEGTTPRRKPSKPAHAAAPPSTTMRRAFGLAALVAASFAILSASAALRNSPRELGGEAARELGGEAAPAPSSYVSSYEVVATMEHDPSAFTQGLAFDAHGRLFESDGLYHQSRVREVDPATGRSVRTATNSPSIFGEGVEVLGDTVIQITWQERKLFEYGLDLKLKRTLDFPIGAEGWGLATDGTTLFLTDSGHELFHVAPQTYALLKRMPIVDARLGGKRVYGVNELEWVEGELWGNVYPMYQHKASECVVRINATSGAVLGWIDLRGLLARQRLEVRRSAKNYVLNGIAYHAASRRLYVTGKKWDKMYQIRLVPTDHDEDYVRSNCNLG